VVSTFVPCFLGSGWLGANLALELDEGLVERRVVGVLLLGVGGMLSAVAGFGICMALWSVAHATTPVRPIRGDSEFELALEIAVVVALLLGNAIMYVGALMRSAPAAELQLAKVD
jgi:hypothetical protein